MIKLPKKYGIRQARIANWVLYFESSFMYIIVLNGRKFFVFYCMSQEQTDIDRTNWAEHDANHTFSLGDIIDNNQS